MLLPGVKTKIMGDDSVAQWLEFSPNEPVLRFESPSTQVCFNDKNLAESPFVIGIKVMTPQLEFAA